EAGKAARRVGEIQQKLGANAAADSAFRRSQQILERLPADPLAAQELAVTANRRGGLPWALGGSPPPALPPAPAPAPPPVPPPPRPPRGRPRGWPGPPPAGGLPTRPTAGPGIPRPPPARP